MTFDNSDFDRGDAPRLPMGCIIEMAFTGLWVILRQGALAEVGGRLHWPDRASLEKSAAEAGIPLSGDIVRTGRVNADHR